MEETQKSESHLTSAAAFVEGGILESFDDSCSICLEAFCESEPSTVTGCKHEFHLQCILEWCQRSSQCPMCWQSISLKDPTSQELLEAVERERSFRFNPSRNSTIFNHPTLGEFELQHIPAGANDAEIEERIIHHLAAAAAMGRARHVARREGQRSRSSAQGRPHFLVFSANPDSHAAPASSSPPQREESESADAVGEESSQQITPLPSAQGGQDSAAANGSHGMSSNDRSSPSQSSPSSQDRAGPSELSFSESMKSRLNSVSMRYKESISKSTRGWKERFFSRNTSIADLGSEVKREVSAGIATVSRMMERLDTKENSSTSTAPMSSSSEDNTVSDQGNQRMFETGGSNHLSDTNVQASHAGTTVLR